MDHNIITAQRFKINHPNNSLISLPPSGLPNKNLFNHHSHHNQNPNKLLTTAKSSESITSLASISKKVCNPNSNHLGTSSIDYNSHQHLTTATSNGQSPEYPPNPSYIQSQQNSQNFTLASVQQQIQPGSLVFASPTMAMTTLAGAGTQTTVQQPAPPTNNQIQHTHQQQLVVTPAGQAVPQFFTTNQTANGQTLIQTSGGMNMMSGLSGPVQVIGNTSTFFPSQFYQPTTMIVQPNLVTVPHNGQNLAILQNGVNNSGTATMITASPMTTAQANQQTAAATVATAVKGQNNQTIVKGLTLSPQKSPAQQSQQLQAVKSSTVNVHNNHHQPIVNGLPTSSHQTAIVQQSNTNTQTIVIGLSGQTNQTTTPMPTTPTNTRRSSGTGRSKPSNLVQKIQSSAAPQLLTQTQFKTSPSFNGGSPVTNSTGNQTIMVQQLAPNQPAILSPLTSFQTIQPGITWTSPQQSTQLVTPNQIQLHSPMFIGTPNSPIQTVGPMQMTSTQHNQSGATGLQVAPSGQTLVTTPISLQPNQSQSINQSTVVTQPTGSNNGRKQVSNKTHTMTTATAQVGPVKRNVRSPGATMSTPTTTPLAPKLAPKSTPSILPPPSVVNGSSSIKLPLPALPKTNTSEVSIGVNTVSSSTEANMKNNNIKTSVATSVGPQITSAIKSSVETNSSNNLVSTGTSSTLDKLKALVSLPSKPIEMKDASISTENKSASALISASAMVNNLNNAINSKPSQTSLKTSLNQTPNIKKPSAAFNSAATQSSNKNSSGVQTSSSTSTNQASSTTNSRSTGSNTSSTSSIHNQNKNGSNKNNKPPSQGQQNQHQQGGKNGSIDVLIHYIDGYLIQESSKPFPIDDSDSEDSEDNNKENGQTNIENREQKESKDQSSTTANQLVAANGTLCVHCGKNERNLQATKKKLRRYCQTCIEKHLKKSQNDSIPKQAINSSTITNQSVNVTQETIQQANKRPLNQSMATTSTENNKKPRLSETTDTTTNSSDEKIWLPPGGKEPNDWTIQDVYDFISKIEDGPELAEALKAQEIDGASLMLLKEDHFTSVFNLKLGKALKICKKIRELKEIFSNL